MNNLCLCVGISLSLSLSWLGFDVNFMDDVGQTLLNWAAAFGSFEMVSLLQPLYLLYACSHL